MKTKAGVIEAGELLGVYVPAREGVYSVSSAEGGDISDMGPAQRGLPKLEELWYRELIQVSEDFE